MNLTVVIEYNNTIGLSNNKKLTDLKLMFFKEYDHPIELSNNKELSDLDLRIMMNIIIQLTGAITKN